MLSSGFPEVLVLIGVAAVIGLSIAALVEAAGRPEHDFDVRGRTFYIVLLAVGLFLPPLGVLTLLRYQLEVRTGVSPEPSQ